MRPSTGNLLESGQYWNDNLRLIKIEIKEQAYYSRKEPYHQLGWKKLVECRRYIRIPNGAYTTLGEEFIWQTSYEYFESWVEAGFYKPVTEITSSEWSIINEGWTPEQEIKNWDFNPDLD
jgi:hypothetical protein